MSTNFSIPWTPLFWQHEKPKETLRAEINQKNYTKLLWAREWICLKTENYLWENAEENEEHVSLAACRMLQDAKNTQKTPKNTKKNVCSVHILLWKTLLGCFLRTLPLPFEAYQRFQVMLNGSGPKWHFSLFIKMKGEKWYSCEKQARNSFQILKNLDKKKRKKTRKASNLKWSLMIMVLNKS